MHCAAYSMWNTPTLFSVEPSLALKERLTATVQPILLYSGVLKARCASVCNVKGSGIDL